MNLHNISLKYFYYVAKTGSLTGAADQLHVAVSAVSRQIKKIEDETGVPLFERKARGMYLTAAGDILMSYAKRSYLELEEAIAQAKGINALHQNVIRLASTEGFAWDLLPTLSAHFRKKNPSVRFYLTIAHPEQVSRMVREGDADIAITYNLTPSEGLKIWHQEISPIYALMQNTHPLASSSIISLHEISHYPVVLPAQGTTIRHLIDIVCSLKGILLDPVFTCHPLNAIYRFTQESEDIVSFSGYLTAANKAKQDNMTLIPMEEPELHQRTLQVQTMAGRKLPAATQAFIDYFIQHLKTLSDK